MAVENPYDLKIKDNIRFRTKNPHDNVTWEGRIVSICDYDTARQSGDVDVFYQEVKRVDNTLSDKENLTYLILKIRENDSVSTKRVFALDWIDVSTLEKVEENSYVDFRVFDVNASKANDILKAISALGYTVEIRS